MPREGVAKADDRCRKLGTSTDDPASTVRGLGRAHRFFASGFQFINSAKGGSATPGSVGLMTGAVPSGFPERRDAHYEAQVPLMRWPLPRVSRPARRREGRLAPTGWRRRRSLSRDRRCSRRSHVAIRAVKARDLGEPAFLATSREAPYSVRSCPVISRRAPMDSRPAGLSRSSSRSCTRAATSGILRTPRRSCK